MPERLADIESDLSVFHRVDDMHAVAPARFFRLAWRLPHYRGALRDRAMAEEREREEAPRGRAPQPVRSRPAAAQPVTEAALSDPLMGTIFDFG